MMRWVPKTTGKTRITPVFPGRSKSWIILKPRENCPSYFGKSAPCRYYNVLAAVKLICTGLWWHPVMYWSCAHDIFKRVGRRILPKWLCKRRKARPCEFSLGIFFFFFISSNRSSGQGKSPFPHNDEFNRSQNSPARGETFYSRLQHARFCLCVCLPSKHGPQSKVAYR